MTAHPTSVGMLGSQSVAVYADLLDHAGDVAQMLVLSDALEEEGHLELAQAYRWAAERGMWPFQRREYPWVNDAPLVWDWDVVDRQWPERPPGVPDCAKLPRKLYQAIKRLPNRRYGTVHDAFVLLGRGLDALGPVVTLPSSQGAWTREDKPCP